MTEQQQAPDTEISPEMSMGLAIMTLKPIVDQLRHFTNGVRADYVRDGYTVQEASAMAAADHVWFVGQMSKPSTPENTEEGGSK